MSMSFLVLMHNETEGPGSLGTYLKSIGAKVDLLKLYEGATLPANLEGFDAVVSMGGPMNVYEEDQYPFLRDETVFLNKVVNAGLPVLGICLGAQMIAKAQGALVTDSPKKEIGWCNIDLTEDGRADTLFQGLPSSMEVMQWHGDMFHIPDGGILLAGSADCPHQAFRYKNAFGLQFHVEVTAEILKDWFSDLPDFPSMIARLDEVNAELSGRAERIYANFVSLIKD
ncbi:MAG: type 1 glutamine amidotransferase [Desulfomonile tiedjei]|uniref:Type 1 glutamine amidotransferase n=1 Tax=Desulfomonile tiedjei TaxID=2358 RepID=A0A9D6V4E8_9BACT|nr:type 1 glutamine amidotransferase [Desulfomonile tiedjei]